ncbi:hypothetical protein SLS62_006058 [Diatrype stigma]|uniref:Uncharacterized protein n=1 Tax=Diatrype stigma TaxID=117547 RepID=A0AAN9URM1_9PEZI
MSTKRDVDELIEFLRATYLQGFGKKVQAQAHAYAHQTPVSSSPKPLLSTMTSTSTLYSSSPIHATDLYHEDDDSNDDLPLVEYNHNHNHNGFNKTAAANNNSNNIQAASPFKEVRELPRPLRTAIPYHQRYAATPPPPPPMTIAIPMASMAMVSDDEDIVAPRQYPMPLPEVACGAAR